MDISLNQLTRRDMQTDNKTRYIVVLFFQGIGYTYQEDGKVHIFFHYSPLTYEKLGHAKNRADKLGQRYIHEKICVFKVELDEQISCDQYILWANDKDRLVYETKGYMCE